MCLKKFGRIRAYTTHYLVLDGAHIILCVHCTCIYKVENVGMA